MTLSDFVVIVMICDVSERDIIQEKNNTHKKKLRNIAKECRLHKKKAGLHLSAAVDMEKAFEF